VLRFFALLIASIAALAVSPVSAQSVSQAQAGDPPLVALINVSNPDANGIVEIAGVAGAVPPNARLAIRNLYTEETLYTQAGVTGSFRVTMFGPGNTPFWISVVSGEIPQVLRERPGSLPGGPGTIIYGPFPESRQASAPVTQLLLDADLADWDTYPRAQNDNLYGLLNLESLYLAVDDLPTGTARLQAVVTIDTNTFEVTVDLLGPQQASARRLAPQENDLGSVPAAFVASAEQVEVRVPTRPIDERYETVTLVEVRLLNAEGVLLSTRPFNQILTPTNEVDGVVRLGSRVGDAPTRFTIGGPVAGGASYWAARGRADRLNLTDRTLPLQLELDVALNAPNYSPIGSRGRMVGQVGLLPVVANVDGTQTVIPAPLTNNGWSTLQTPGGLAIDNLGETIFLAETSVDLPQIVFRNGQLIFGFTYEISIPDDIPSGLYVPVFRGFVEIGESRIPWEANGPFGAGNRMSRIPQTRLPILLNLGETQPVRLLWTLFEDAPSEGARGLLSEADQLVVALSNRTQFNSPTYILPPNNYATGQPLTYPLEPYMLNQMPNAYATSSAPLVPFLLPGGRLVVSVTTPDGRTDNLGSTPILQNQLSTPTLDERERYSESSPLDAYRLTTLNPLLRAYTFSQYGEHVISMTGTVEDVWGNRYEGGGNYRVLIAEPLDISPGVLPGTPFEVGDAFSPVVRLLPGLPADVTIRLRVYPLDGGPVQENIFEGQANRFGYFHAAGAAVRFGVPGEYVVDYEVRYTDSVGRLWAGSMRSAGVIADPASTLIAHGARGLSVSGPEMRPAWFDASHYAGTNGVLGNALFPNLPYHSGDVAWVIDGDNGGLQPIITAQDTEGVYATWLERMLSDGSYRERVVREELPVTMLNSAEALFGPALAPDALMNESYAYFSAARAGVTASQLVLGAEGGTVPTLLEPDDRYNYQTGAGITGDRAGDFLFLFGGAVVRNPQAQLADTAIYGALAVIVPENDPRGTRVYPPFGAATGGPNGGPLLTFGGQPVEMFFVPTATQPGGLLTLGDTLSVAGQVAPTLPSTVSVTVTSPSGIVRQFEAQANAIGYFYRPEQDIVTDEAGVWTVDVSLRHEGLTSAGPVEPPVPTGSILRRSDDRYVVYVAPPQAELLRLDRSETILPPALRYNISFAVPPGWLDVRVDYSVTMPGMLVDEGQLTVTGNTFSYAYSPDDLRARVPNFEVDGRVTGPWVSDPLTLTLVMSGTDNFGLPNMMVRQIQLINDRLLSLNE
jgi:hypothetical protein